MKKVAILGGTGRLGQGIALRLAAAGVDVLVGSRTQDKADRVVDEITAKLADLDASHGQLTPLANGAAAEQGDPVVMTVPYPTYRDLLPTLRSALSGKTVIDTTVPLTSFKPPQLEFPRGRSAAEEIQELLGSEVRVVAGFKTSPASELAEVAREMTSDVFVCGDDESGKTAALQLAETTGARAFDVGGLERAKVLEELTAMMIELNFKHKRHAISLRLTDV